MDTGLQQAIARVREGNARQIYGVSQHAGSDIDRLLRAADEAADLRRQLEHANRWRDNEILAANEARADAADLRRQLDRERIAAIQHAIWSHWMTYQFSVCLRNDDGTMTIPAQKVMRWERQAATPYAELSEAERESDRHQADRILAADDSPHRAEKGDE